MSKESALARMSHSDLIEWREEKIKCEDRLFHLATVIWNIQQDGESDGDYKRAIQTALDRTMKSLKGDIRAVKLIDGENRRKDKLKSEEDEVD